MFENAQKPISLEECCSIVSIIFYDFSTKEACFQAFSKRGRVLFHSVSPEISMFIYVFNTEGSFKNVSKLVFLVKCCFISFCNSVIFPEENILLGMFEIDFFLQNICNMYYSFQQASDARVSPENI